MKNGDDDQVKRALEHAAEATGQPKAVAQVIITALDNNTVNLQYTCDEMLARALLSKAEFILNFQAQQQIAGAQRRIAPPSNGDLRRFGAA